MLEIFYIKNARHYSWMYLLDYLGKDGLVNVSAYSKIAFVVEISCIDWVEI